MASTFVKNKTLNIAKGRAPVDTGNLRYNAIHLRRSKPNSWTIHYSGTDAYYLEALEDGTKYTQKHKLFIYRTSIAIASFLEGYYSGKTTNRWSYYTRGGEKSTNERELRHFESTHRESKFSWR